MAELKEKLPKLIVKEDNEIWRKEAAKVRGSMLPRLRKVIEEQKKLVAYCERTRNSNLDRQRERLTDYQLAYNFLATEFNDGDWWRHHKEYNPVRILDEAKTAHVIADNGASMGVL